MIGYLTESNWTPRFKSNTLTPRTNSQTYWPREIFTRDGWKNLLCLFNISHFSSIHSLTSGKRTQEDAGEERVSAKSKPMMNLVSRCQVRYPSVLASTASESPGNTKILKSERTSELVKCAANKYGETRIGRQLIKLLSMDY